MKTQFLFICSLFILIQVSFAQIQTLQLKPGPVEGKDISLWNNAPFQIGATEDLEAYAWTNQGNPGFKRILIDFDWSQIPANATIVSATLSLFHNPTGPSMPGHSQQSGSNASVLQRVTSPWNEMTVTWNTQPTTTTQNQISIPATTSSTQNFHIDVKTLVIDILNDLSNSHGFMLRLATEQYYRSLIFASSDHPNPLLWPELNIEYTLSDLPCIVLKPGSELGKDISLWNNAPFQMGATEDLEAYAWTNQGNPGFKRILIDFDWSQIPANATIVSATLSLFHNPTGPSMPGHSQQSGSNASVLQRVTSPWDEMTVTWNTQPTSTTQNQISISTTTSSTQDFHIDVKTLVVDILNDLPNSHGFMLRLVTEQYYRSLIFASSDHTNPQLWPEIEVCWEPDPSQHTGSQSDINNSWLLYPNPASEQLHISFSGTYFPDDAFFKMYSFDGKEIISFPLTDYSRAIELNNINNGLYLIVISSEFGIYHSKIIRQ